MTSRRKPTSPSRSRSRPAAGALSPSGSVTAPAVAASTRKPRRSPPEPSTRSAVAAFLFPVVWWGHGAADVILVGYLGYLRRQVRIEEEIRQRRLARYQTRAPRRPAPPPELDEEDLEDVEDVQVIAPVRREVVERRPAPAPRVRRNAVVVDLDDEDPAFHELDEPGEGPYRRAVGE